MVEHNENSKNRATAYRMLAAEAGITAAIALLVYTAMGAVAARSAVLAGLIFGLPNLLFVGFALRPAAGRPAESVFRGLYVGEALKLLATAVLFAACFVLVKPLSAGVLLVTYVTLLLVNVAGNAWLMN